MNGPPETVRERRGVLLAWLAGQLNARGITAEVLDVDGAGILRAHAKCVRHVACVPVPQHDTWAFVYSGGWVLVNDPLAADTVVRAVAR
ncbi:hypothetical protein BJF79_18590 [Actinomadura sp. CNU-125]|uniref:hypothetical protein n=1 Tax=Actinomadura sp. CNU-125 TaxID=1904961 RepID=UPI0009593CB0|nr:hypothetical protein [Actinomadura sp. CNU-125]OLT16064.1 hypothetical protein BJF79_18590 [Actinomadura sp. CNU-125]